MSDKATLNGYGAPVCVVLICSAMCVATTDSLAQVGGRPLILDTQTGIQSGAGGTVLQTGPLNGAGMVPTRPLATLPEVQPQGQQTIVVSPYIAVQPSGYSGPQGYAIAPANQSQSGSSGIQGLRSATSNSAGLRGVPSSIQSRSQPQSRAQPPSAQAQTFEQSRSQSRTRPTVPIAPTSAVTKPATGPRTSGSKPRTQAGAADPHMATGTVTSLQ